MNNILPIRLGLNIDHVATLRNARGGQHPDPCELAMAGLAAGADSITVHLREDRRHIRDEDVIALKSLLPAPMNLEMAATGEMKDFALSILPHACCIVPEKREERTTEGGLDLSHNTKNLESITQQLASSGIRVSLFVEPDAAMMKTAQSLGARVVELHTGRYAEAIKEGERETASEELAKIRQAAETAHALGLEVHAGHGLDEESAYHCALIPEIVELNIGHFIVGHALSVGMLEAVRRMRAVMDSGRRNIANR